MVSNPGGLAVGITVLVLVGFSIIAAIITHFSRRAMQKAEEVEEANRLGDLPPPVPPKGDALANSPSKFNNPKSLSQSSLPSLPSIPHSPGIRIEITTPSHHSKSSNDSLPSVESVLERYDREMQYSRSQASPSNSSGGLVKGNDQAQEPQVEKTAKAAHV